MPATEKNGFGPTDLTTPDDGEAVTPHDSNDFAGFSRYLYVGGAGSLSVRTITGTTLVFAAVPAGTTLGLRAKGVNLTGTSATSIVALY
jgi:hypothetical protein